MSTLTEIGDYLELHNCGVQGQTLFLGSRPDDPDTVLTVYQYPGGNPEYLQELNSPAAEMVQIQIVVRAIDYNEADRLASKAWQALAPVRNQTLSGVKYRSIRPNHSPALMGRDANDRILVFFNATVEKEVSLVA